MKSRYPTVSEIIDPRTPGMFRYETQTLKKIPEGTSAGQTKSDIIDPRDPALFQDEDMQIFKLLPKRTIHQDKESFDNKINKEAFAKSGKETKEREHTMEAEKMETAREYPRRESYEEGRGPGSYWGNVQHAYMLAPGVQWVDTAGHGGLMVSESAAHKYLSPKARVLGSRWGNYYCYEEDEQWMIAFFERPEWMESMLKAGGFSSMPSKEEMEVSIKKYHPQYFEDKEIKETPRFKDLKAGDQLTLTNGTTYKIGEVASGHLKLEIPGTQGYAKLSKTNYSRMMVKLVRDGAVLFERQVEAALACDMEIVEVPVSPEKDLFAEYEHDEEVQTDVSDVYEHISKEDVVNYALNITEHFIRNSLPGEECSIANFQQIRQEFAEYVERNFDKIGSWQLRFAPQHISKGTAIMQILSPLWGEYASATKLQHQ